ncbi:unnamed protein product [Linum tenue]|uniref:Amine oxidase domain-containing protein n=1 Tax=Linum tenue TaxID=586396 RepID=A0AAV0M7T9_9ROSI|nr:unnamed protein product [Linum tenue]
MKISQQSMAALVFALLLITLAGQSAATASSVIVIGAGMSGIFAAKTLYEAGITDIVMLEGSSRIGGRMMKAELDGYTVEFGANWFNTGGPLQNAVASLANKTKLRSSRNGNLNMSANTYGQEGSLYPKQLVDQVQKVASDKESFYERYSAVLSSISKAEGVDIDVSILEAQRLLGNVPSSSLEMVMDYFNNDYEDGDPPMVSSLKHTYPRREAMDHGDVTNFVCDRRGFEVLVQDLARQFVNRSSKHPKLLLDKVVKEIFYTTNRGVRVETEDGSTYQAKYAVVSVSLGVLQSNLIRFAPTLPRWKTDAISSFDMAVYTKIFLKFPYKFWPAGPGTGYFLYAHARRGYYPVWQHLENEYPGSNILFVTVTGDESRRVERLPGEDVQKEAMDVLRKMYGSGIPEPERILVPRWAMDRNRHC